jgi:hypothetical protein
MIKCNSFIGVPSQGVGGGKVKAFTRLKGNEGEILDSHSDRFYPQKQRGSE